MFSFINLQIIENMRIWFAITLFTICIHFASAQKNLNKFYKKNPVWIDMIKDPNVNYFEAVKAYDSFWSNRKKPVEEDLILNQNKGVNDTEKDKISRRALREKRREKLLNEKYGFECKKFEHWKMQVKPYVQADGSILSKEAQLKLWEDKK
jgi:hypothetical protein